MSMRAEDIDALIDMLRRDADLRRRVFLALLPEEFLALPARVDHLTELVAQVLERQTRLEERQLALEERQARLEERFAALEERQARMEERQDRLEESHRLLVEIVNRMDERLSRVEHVVLTPQEIEDRVLDALTPQEQKDPYETDLLLHGRLAVDTSRELVLAMEISITIKLHDVQRASRRVDLMRKAGYLCIPAVGGGAIVSRARREASRLGVVVALDGSIQGWEEALSGLIA
ncbi:MAG: hypothetical protein C4335_08805 [Armatimonadota bacterium]